MIILPVSKDGWYGLPYAVDLAVIYAMLGQPDAALDEIEHVLAVPSWVSPTWLAFDFRFDDLRDNRRFQALLEGEVSTDR